MLLMVYSSGMSAIGCIDNYNSLIWVRRSKKAGTFELQAPATENNLMLIKKHNIIKKEDDSEIGYFTGFTISSSEDGEVINATGNLYTGKLSQRVVTSNATTLYGIISNNLRGLNITLSSTLQDIAITDNFIGYNLLEVLETSAVINDFCFMCELEGSSPVMKIYSGIDSSTEQTANNYCIFSDDYENLQEAEYSDSDEGVVNTVYARAVVPPGTEPCTPPTYDIVPSSGEKYEKYVQVDAVTYDLQITQALEGGSVTITRTYLDSNATLEALKTAAISEIVPVQQFFEGTVDFKHGYKSKFDLGDRITIIHNKWGITVSQTITEVTETYDNQTNSIVPTFGNAKLTILDLIKKRGK